MPSVASRKSSLSERILAVLDESPLPVRTADLVALTATGMPNARAQVWEVLRRLELAGLVRRTSRHPTGTRWAGEVGRNVVERV